MRNAPKKAAAASPRDPAELIRENAIIVGSSESTKSLILAHGTIVNLALRDKIYDPDEDIADVYFPISCVLSIVAMMRDGNEIEIGTIGREGMSAFPLMLGAATSANISYCQVKGDAVRIPTALFRRLLAEDAAFRRMLDRYIQAYVNMLGQLAACNRLHSIYERCARWLLLTHDRVGCDTIHLTQEFLAMMLGTGRSGVTIAASTLQQAGFIRYSHGIIDILNREGLELATCECYDLARKQFAGLLHLAAASDPQGDVAFGDPGGMPPPTNPSSHDGDGDDASHFPSR